MNGESKLRRLLLVSPWFLLVFLVVPAITILSFTMHLRLPLVGPKLLLFNNAALALLAAARFVRYLARFKAPIRYGVEQGEPEQGETASLSREQAREAFSRAGYSFDSAGRYGEKRDLGYLGTVLLYAGLFLLLGFGTADNLRQFSGTLQDGIGISTDLAKLDSYRLITKGPLATGVKSLPKMRIVNQLMPSGMFPRGATEALFLTPEGKEMHALLRPEQPFPYDDFDICMSKVTIEPEIVISTDKNQVVFNGFVKLNPLVRKRDGFSFYGTFAQGNLTGDVYFQPDNNRLKVLMRRNGKRVMNAELIYQGERLVGQADLVLTCEKMGLWSELSVVRRRHLPLVAAGGALALVGLLLRLSVGAKRVWLRESAEGVLVKSSAAEAKRILAL
jgi:hypothetical protein